MNELVALALPHGQDFVEEMRRVFDEGDAVLPLDGRLAGPAAERVVASLRPSAIVAAPGEVQRLDLGIPVEPGDALVMATSGTTGEPKGVVLTHDAVLASSRATLGRIGRERDDAWWACLPFSHVGGLSVVLRAVHAGSKLHVSVFSPTAAEEAIAAGATLTALVPTAFGRLPEPVRAAFRRIVLGGQAPPPGLPSNVVTTYGMTETGSGVVYDGVPLEGVEVRIAAGSEIELRGPMLLRCYRDGSDPKREGGWLPTGDAGEIGGDGLLRVRGRIEDMIVSGGENVWPQAVEPLVERHPAVLEAAVAGVADPEWGQRVTAFVVTSGAVEAAALLAEVRDLVRGELAAYAAPRQLVLVEKLPRTGIGKLRRGALATLRGPSASL